MAEIIQQVNAKIPFEVVLDHPGAEYVTYQIVEQDDVAWGATLKLQVQHSLHPPYWATVGTLDADIAAARLRQGPKEARGLAATRIYNSAAHASDKYLLIIIRSHRGTS